jgi:hypothetical protein
MNSLQRIFLVYLQGQDSINLDYIRHAWRAAPMAARDALVVTRKTLMASGDCVIILRTRRCRQCGQNPER